MATYSNNTTIKFLQGVTLTGNSSYTIPANCYGIMSRALAGSSAPIPEFAIPGGSSSIDIDGNSIASSNNGSNSRAADATGPISMYIPAGKVITTSVSGKASAYVLITVFQNTP